MSKNGYHVDYQSGMLNIDSHFFGFGLIENMYTTGHGVSLQPGVDGVGHEKEIEDACMKIHGAMQELDKLMLSFQEKKK
jgi:hypothetical protein